MEFGLTSTDSVRYDENYRVLYTRISGSMHYPCKLEFAALVPSLKREQEPHNGDETNDTSWIITAQPSIVLFTNSSVSLTLVQRIVL